MLLREDDLYATRALLPRLRPVLIPTDIEVAGHMRTRNRQREQPSMISSGDWKRTAEWCAAHIGFTQTAPTKSPGWASYAEWSLSFKPSHIASQVKLPGIYKCHADLQWASERDVPWRASAIARAHKKWRTLGKRLRTNRWIGQLNFDKELRLPHRISIEHSSWDREVVRAWAGQRHAAHAAATAGDISRIPNAFAATPIPHVTAASLGLSSKPEKTHIEAAARAVAKLRQLVQTEHGTGMSAVATSQGSIDHADSAARPKPAALGLSKLDKQVLAGRSLAVSQATGTWQRLALRIARNPKAWVGESLFQQELSLSRHRHRHPLPTLDDEDDAALNSTILRMIRRVDAPSDAAPASTPFGLSPPSKAEHEAASRAVAHIRRCVSEETKRAG